MSKRKGVVSMDDLGLKAAIAVFLLLAGCENPQGREQWKCFDGNTYSFLNGAWVKLDGHPYIGMKDGPVQCVNESPSGRGEKP